MAALLGEAAAPLVDAPLAPETLEHLLRAPETAETVAALGDAACAASVRALTLRVCSELQGGDAVSNALAQRQLATALLRWTILRAPDQQV